jgi:hypothetical protein
MNIDWKGFPEAVALALAGLTALVVAAPLDTNARTCMSGPVRAAEHRIDPVAPMSIEDAALRDMLLHD